MTIQNALGFAITFAPLAIVPVVAAAFGWKWAFLVLVPGPALGVWAVGGLLGSRARAPPEGMA